nr:MULTISPECIES: sporulation protein [unclassified Streptomyces]
MVASTARRTRPPNADLARLIEACGASKKSLALRVNQLAHQAGMETDYSHTSIANWCQRGMIPKWPVPTLLAQAIGERLGRPVDLREIGMGEAETPDADVGLDFPRDRADAVRVATSFWSSVNRRDFLTGSGFAVSAFTTPVTRWLVTPADGSADHTGGQQVGRADLDELRDAADEARRWDSKYGGGNWKANSVTACLTERAAPLLRGSFSDAVGRELFSVTAELSRLAGWTAFDVGQHDAAQRHFIQALRLARAGRDVQLGCYVLTTMAMQSLLRGFASEAVDMAQGAFERAKGHAAPRVLAFTKLIEARAHARDNDPKAASRALAASETLLGLADARPGDEPGWIDFYHHARLSADAAEVFRDLKNPKAAWPGTSRPPPCRPGCSPAPSACDSPSSAPPTSRPVTSTKDSISATGPSTSSPVSSPAAPRTTSASSPTPSPRGAGSRPSATSLTAPAPN